MAGDKIQLSIHPRSWPGGFSPGRDKSNTCGNSSLAKRLMRQLAGIEAHLERHPKDTMSQQRVSVIKSLLMDKQQKVA